MQGSGTMAIIKWHLSQLGPRDQQAPGKTRIDTFGVFEGVNRKDMKGHWRAECLIFEFINEFIYSHVDFDLLKRGCKRLK